MITAVTGPSQLTPTQRRYAAERLAALLGTDTLRSGCAFGIDTVAAYVAVAAGYDLELFVPFARHNGTLVNRLAVESRVIRLPKLGGGPANEYRHRNSWMIKGHSASSYSLILPADRLHAFVLRPTFYRSGEWMTINIAERAGIDVILEVLPKVWAKVGEE